MVYNTIRDFSKKTLHALVDHSTPNNPKIAAISGFVGLFVYNSGMTYVPGILLNQYDSQMKSFFGCDGIYDSFWLWRNLKLFKCKAVDVLEFFTAPWFVPSLSPTISTGVS